MVLLGGQHTLKLLRQQLPHARLKFFDVRRFNRKLMIDLSHAVQPPRVRKAGGGNDSALVSKGKELTRTALSTPSLM
jgi:hypothetical protein